MDKPEKLNKPRLGMQHFNNNVLCAVDVETTGTDPEKDEIVQLAILPLDSSMELSEEQLAAYNRIRDWVRQHHTTLDSSIG